MNFAQQLAHGPTINAKPEKWKGRPSVGQTTESIAKQVATKQRIRHNKWRNHFNQFPEMTATLEEIAKHIKQANSPTLAALKSLEDEGAVTLIGKSWKWITGA